MSNEEWELFRVFPEFAPAETLRMQLEAGDVPARVESSALESGRETHFRVLVLKALVHRARWVVAQLPMTDAELNYLATGKLPGGEDA